MQVLYTDLMNFFALTDSQELITLCVFGLFIIAVLYAFKKL